MSETKPNLKADQPVVLHQHRHEKTTDPAEQDTVTASESTGAFHAQSAAMFELKDDLLPKQVLPAIPGYEIKGELGRGGMGVVYRAWHTTLNRPVAIKMILGGKYTDPVSQARFTIEAEVIAAIQHPNIVQVYEFGRHDDQPFFVLEYIGGGSLAGKLRETSRFSQRDAATMVAKLADGITVAHQKGVIHRDLKPANVLLTEAGEPKITDFGLAKTVQSDMTATGAVMGTPCYMSPEQAAGKTREVGTPTDVYALGVILYELLTGRLPFKGDTVMATIQQVLTREPERPRGIDPNITRDLETICLKCLEKDAKSRYATASELVTELRAFIDGRPIAARPVGLLERTWKWTKRNPKLTVGIAVGLMLLVVATLTGVAIRAATHAAGLVKAVLNADTSQVPVIVSEMVDYRKWVDPQLREENNKAPINSRQKLNTSLALLPVDDREVDYLYQRFLNATPQELAVIRDALVPHKAKIQDKLWVVVEKTDKGKAKQRLRAAAALAYYEPESEKWTKAGNVVVNELVQENPIYLERWSDAFRPVKQMLIPRLSEIYCHQQQDFTAECALATNILADYAADQPMVLADLLMNGNEKQFAIIYPKLKDHAEQGSAILSVEIDKKLSAELPSSDPHREALAKRQANAGVALILMNLPSKVWPLLQHSSDPRVRSYIIHKLSPLGADAKSIINQLNVEANISIRRALLLSLGEYNENEISQEDQRFLVSKLQEIYLMEADPGLHAASEWVLRKWNLDAWLKLVNEKWAKGNEERKKRLDDIRQVLKNKEESRPQWYVNGQGQTMVIIPGPVTFMMGSPGKEAARDDDELPHKRRINRTFAVASTPVTKIQFLRFLPTISNIEIKPEPGPNNPFGGVIWYEGAMYCNWLSKEEGIPEDQWCYELNRDVLKIKLKKNYLSLIGYRLPTEAEMEYVTRAGASTSRYFGETDELLPKYGWYTKNSQDKSWPVGSLKPNDLGFFDVQGNVYTWCQESYKPYGANNSDLVDDIEDDVIVKSTFRRPLRGGGFAFRPSFLRSAARNVNVPTTRSLSFGFRVSRTMPLR